VKDNCTAFPGLEPKDSPGNRENTMDQKTFDRFRDIVYEKSGIAINPNKVSLVIARVGKRMRELAIDNPREYLQRLLDDETGEEIVHLLDNISTNVTSFFREKDHFDFLGSYVRELSVAGQTRFRFWSAASSSGEEPYSIAMTVLDALSGKNTDIRILATDISTRVLKKCEQGKYPESKVGTVPPKFRTAYMEKEREGSNDQYLVKDSLRRLLTFTRLNLSQTPFPMNGPMDAIFCRNVMIYFDNVVRKRLLDECFRLLKKGGYLFVGHAETLTGIISTLRRRYTSRSRRKEKSPWSRNG
jgi:chemotaxis protein methyltransferase CheR